MMLNRKAYAEAYNIISLMSPELIKKIPENVLRSIENKMDKTNVRKINDVRNYKISLQAYEILAVLYRKYYATEEEKMIIKAKQLCLRRKKYSIFN